MINSAPDHLSWLRIILLIFYPAAALCQEVTLDADFESQDFTSPVTWTGDLHDFTFNLEGSQTRLQLSSEPEPSRSQIRTHSATTHGSWEFYFRQEFTSSNLNRAFIFLMSDRENLNYLDGSSVNGYAIRTGENGESKRIRLIRFDNGIQHEILSSGAELEPDLEYRIKVTRNRTGAWQLHTTSNIESDPVPDSDIITDTTHSDARFFGILLRYTSANTNRFFFDHIRIIDIPEPFSVEFVEAVDPYTLSVELNRPLNPVSLQETQFIIDGQISAVEAEIETASTIRINFSEPIAIGQTHLTITGLLDDSNQPLQNTHSNLILTVPAKANDLIINEIMYDPLPPSEYHISGQSEYIEFYNRREYALSVNGFQITDNPDNPVLASSIRVPNGDQVWVAPHGYLLFYPEAEEENFEMSRIGRYFGLSHMDSLSTVRFQRSTLGLTLSGRHIALTDEQNNVIDEVHYQPDWHNPNLVSTRGISLERVNPEILISESDNWSSSTDGTGGTPGIRNSLYQAPALLPVQTEITLDPNPFSPFEDSNDRNLFINYSLDEPDYLVRIRIFDRYGRLVRNLIDSYPAGLEGKIIWDGKSDDGGFNRMGIYIILFEAYNSSTGRNRTFRETAVIARQF
jgi:hypothetical protein